MRGSDIEAEIPLTLEEAHHGIRRSITLQGPDGPKTLEVTIPAGVREGSLIRLAGQGEPGVGNAPAGDLFLRVRLEPHPLFRIVGDGDVQIDLPVAPWEAALGARVTVLTLDGSDVGANLPSIAVILDMLDRLAALQRENEWLRSQNEGNE